jgi:hypothetical protein
MLLLLDSFSVKGAGPGGKSVLESLRSDICGPCMINPGDDIATTMLGVNNIANQVLAGLIVLEGKFKAVKPSQVQSTGPFNSQIAVAIGAYLGVGSDSLGTTPLKYVTSVMYGDSYAQANGGSSSTPPSAVATTNTPATTTAPTTTVASGNNLATPGC